MLTLTLTLLLTLGDPVVSKLLELDDVTLELDVVLGVTAGVTLDVMLWDTSVNAEPLELDEVVADILVL